MANVYATKTGNWSDTTVWNTGALPTVNDDVYSNTYTVTIDQTVKVLSIRNIAASPAVAGGTFILTGDYTVECTSGGLVSGTVTLLTYNGTGTAIIKSGIFGGSTGITLIKSGIGTLNFTGDIYSNTFTTCQITGSGIFNFVGNLFANLVAYATSTCIDVAGNNIILNITGNLSGSAASCVQNTSAINNCLVSITGNIITASSSSNNTPIALKNSSSSGSFNIIGNVTPSAGQPCVLNTSLISINITGIATASATSVAISNNNASAQLNLDNAIMINSTTRMAVSATIITLTPGTSLRWQFLNKTLTSNVNLYPAGVSLGNPIVSNVRSGTTYGPSSELTGTLIVPSPANVRRGVATDNTVGTADLTAEDFLTSILTSSNAVAVRLKNVATTDTLGSQLAAFTP